MGDPHSGAAVCSELQVLPHRKMEAGGRSIKLICVQVHVQGSSK
jgi:hypothetical protein